MFLSSILMYYLHFYYFVLLFVLIDIVLIDIEGKRLVISTFVERVKQNNISQMVHKDLNRTKLKAHIMDSLIAR